MKRTEQDGNITALMVCARKLFNFVAEAIISYDKK